MKNQMKLEDVNTVGLPADQIQEHVFLCHEEIRRLRAVIAAKEAMSMAHGLLRDFTLKAIERGDL